MEAGVNKFPVAWTLGGRNAPLKISRTENEGRAKFDSLRGDCPDLRLCTTADGV
jgi:hypothetical protein